MPLTLSVVFAIVFGAAEGLPLSGRGHLALLTALESDELDALFVPAASVGIALGLAIASFGRWFAIAAGTAELVTQPGRYRSSDAAREAASAWVALAIGVAGAIWIKHASADLARSPLAEGVGMLATALMLSSTLVAPGRTKPRLRMDQALAVGLCQSFAALPGGSYVGAAFAALVWTGSSRVRACDLAIALAAPQAIVDALSALGASGALGRLAERPGATALLAFACAASTLAGTALFRRLADKRVAHLAGFTLVVGSSLAIYAWALAGRG